LERTKIGDQDQELGRAAAFAADEILSMLETAAVI
jgi:hypothetical protein